MLKVGNSKLGKSILTWSIPAVLTCPGRSKACESVCYARKGYFRMTGVRTSHLDNYRLSKSKTFVKNMIAALAKHTTRVVRLHPSGDIYSAAYAKKWLEVAKASPDKVFLCYTRSWRIGSILPVLKELAHEPNVRLWFSADKDTGAPPKVSGVRRCYMALSDLDVPKYEVDLVFRNSPKTLMKFDPRGRQVCPPEQNVQRQVKITCSSCTLCWRAKTQLPVDSRLRVLES